MTRFCLDGAKTTASGCRDALAMADLIRMDSEITEPQRVVIIEPRLEMIKDCFVVIRAADMRGTVTDAADLAMLDDQLACLEDVPRQFEHPPAVFARSVNRDVRIGTQAKMPL